MIIALDPSSATPPYAQIHAQVTTMVHSGVLQPEDRLPTIRHLAKDLAVAANTVARAYRELEADGVVATRGRHGTFVLAAPPVSSAASAEGVADAAQTFAVEAAHRGLDLDEALDAVRAAFTRIDDRTRMA